MNSSPSEKRPSPERAIAHLTEAVDALTQALIDGGYLTVRRSKQVAEAIALTRSEVPSPVTADDDA